MPFWLLTLAQVCKIMVFSNQYSFPLHFVEMKARKGVFRPPTLAPMTPKYLPETQGLQSVYYLLIYLFNIIY